MINKPDFVDIAWWEGVVMSDKTWYPASELGEIGALEIHVANGQLHNILAISYALNVTSVLRTNQMLRFDDVIVTVCSVTIITSPRKPGSYLDLKRKTQLVMYIYLFFTQTMHYKNTQENTEIKVQVAYKRL